MDRRHFVQACAALPLVAGIGLPARAQDSTAPRLGLARIVTNFATGSSVDIVARLVAEKLVGSYADSVIVENRVGGGGQVGVASIKKEKADGSVLLMTPIAIMSVYPSTYSKLGYDPIAEFRPLSRATVYDRCFAVGSAVPASVKTIADFGAWAKENKQYATFGSPAAGSPLHFTGILIGRELGVDLLHVPYRGTIAAVPDLAEGRLPAYVSPLGDLLKHTSDGRIRIIGTSGDKRSPFAPEIPSFLEQGLKGLGAPESYVFFAPRAMPADVASRVSTAIAKALGHPDVKRVLTPLCMEPSASTPAELGSELQASMDYWRPIVQSIGFKADS